MSRGKSMTLLAGAATAAAVVALGGGASAAAMPQQAAVSAAKRTVNVRSTSLGKILVDSHGRTLYLFKKDANGKSRCSGACATFWPPLRTSGKPRAGHGASGSKLGLIKRSDGTRQVTYHGHPLYRFAMDKKAGQTNGEGVSAFGARWYVVSPAGKQVTSRSSGTNGGGGY